MARRTLLPTNTHLPAGKGSGWPTHLGAFLPDGSLAVVLGRSASWQRVLVYDASLRLCIERPIAGADDESQPHRLFVVDGSLVLTRLWGPNLRLDGATLASMPLDPIFVGAGTGVQRSDGGVVVATLARNRGEQTAYRFAAGAAAPFGPWRGDPIGELRLQSPSAAQECGLLLRAGEHVLVSTFTTMRGGTHAPMLSLVDAAGTIAVTVVDDDVLGRDGDLAWDPTTRQLVAVDPERKVLERRSETLQLVEREPLGGVRLLASDPGTGRFLWYVARTKELVVTEPGERPPTATASAKTKPSRRGPAASAPTAGATPMLQVLLAPVGSSIRSGDLLRLDAPAPLTLGAAATCTIRIRGAKKVAPVVARFERSEDTWRIVAESDADVWVNDTRGRSATLTHGDIVHAALSFRFLVGPWAVARSEAHEAAIAAAPDDCACWSAYAAWLTERGDPLGARMLRPRPAPTAEDARWLGRLCQGGGPGLAVEWFFGLPRALTITRPFALPVLFETDEARFLRRLVLDIPRSTVAHSDAEQALERLAMTASLPLLETLQLRLPRGLVRPPYAKSDEQLQERLAAVRAKHPRLGTTWETLIEEW